MRGGGISNWGLMIQQKFTEPNIHLVQFFDKLIILNGRKIFRKFLRNKKIVEFVSARVRTGDLARVKRT